MLQTPTIVLTAATTVVQAAVVSSTTYIQSNSIIVTTSSNEETGTDAEASVAIVESSSVAESESIIIIQQQTSIGVESRSCDNDIMAETSSTIACASTSLESAPEVKNDVWDGLYPSARKLHSLIKTTISYESRKLNGRDYVFRLTATLSFPSYIKDLIYLSSHAYYNIPLSTVTNLQDAISAGSSYKPVVPNKPDFYREFCVLYVKQYCT